MKQQARRMPRSKCSSPTCLRERRTSGARMSGSTFEFTTMSISSPNENFQSPPHLNAVAALSDEAVAKAFSPNDDGLDIPGFLDRRTPGAVPHEPAKAAATANASDAGPVQAALPTPGGASTPSRVEEALQLASRGLRVFQVRPNGKSPAFEGWQEAATTDFKTLRAWFRTSAADVGYNVGVFTDEMLVIDIDPRNGGDKTWAAFLEEQRALGNELPETFTVRTWSGGQHVYLWMPGNERVSGQNPCPGIGAGVDVKGLGNLVVGPGSEIDGKRYTVIVNADIAIAPRWLIELCRVARPKAADAGKRIIEETEAAVEQARKYVARWAPEALDGERNNTAFKVAARLYDFGLEVATCQELMSDWNAAKCFPPLEEDELETIIDSAKRSRRKSIGCHSPSLPAPVGVDPLSDVKGDEPVEKVGGDGAPSAFDAEPVDLWAAGSPPAKLPQGVVPEIVECLARSGGRRLGIEPGALAAAYITALGSLVPSGNRLQMRQLDTGWTVRPILWCMPIGDSSTRKSALCGYAMAPVHSVQDRWLREYAVAMQRQKAPAAAVTKTKKPIASGPPNQSSDAVFQGDAIEVIEATEIPFRRKIVNDATTESVGRLLAENPDGLLYYAEELASWLGSMDAYKARRGADRPFWLEAKEGRPKVIDRVTRGRIAIPCCAVSVLGGIQPDIIRAHADNLDDDGLLQRFLPVLVDQRDRGVDEAPDEALQTRIDEVALALAQAESERLFKFSPDGDAERTAIEDFVEREARRPSAPPALKQWLNKQPNEFGRIALIYHFIEWYCAHPGGPSASIPNLISRETAQRARRFLMEFVFSHARAFYEGVLGRSNVDVHARWVAGFILARERGVIEARDIYKNYPALKKQDRRGDIPAVMYDLEMHGWVRLISHDTHGKPSKWKVNPMAHDGRFAERAKMEKAHRQGVQEKIAQAGAARRAAA
jgi:hypothetical protein